MQAHAITTDGRPVAQVQRRLQRYLPGLDVRLEQFSPLQAIAPGPLLRALATDYDDPAAVLAAAGVQHTQPLDDAAVLALLRTRDLRDLDARPRAAAPPVQGLDWHLDRCRVPAGWQLVGGPDAIDWTGVQVGQIDTGYTRHPAYGFPQTWVQEAAARTFWPDPPVDAPTQPPPELGGGRSNLTGVNRGHGTKTGCTIAGHAPGDAFFGVAPKVPVVPVRICNLVLINDRQREFVRAVEHLVDGVGVQVINVSLGIALATVDKTLKRAIDHAYDRGVIVACAAGQHVQNVVAPASLRRTLAVAGTTTTDVPWIKSSFGPAVDLSAPAVDIRNALARSGDRYSYARDGDGTSYAVAMVSGAAALWLVHHRSAIAAAYPLPWQRVEAFKAAARSSARRPPGWQSNAFGDGILDVRQLLDTPLPAAAALAEDPANA